MYTCDCVVVAREASREVRGCGFQPHEACSVAILARKMMRLGAQGRWFVGPPRKIVFSIY
jgi:hypothetical protein